LGVLSLLRLVDRLLETGKRQQDWPYD